MAEKITIEPGFGRIMVMVPHQDDELLLCAGILSRAAETGNPVTVVMVTNGDYGDTDGSTGRTRLKETIAGLELLGIQEKYVEFLGYADTGMPEEDSFLYRLYQSEDSERGFVSHCSAETYGLEEHEEYHLRVYGTHGCYNRRTVAEDIEGVIGRYEPDHLFTTSEYDSHGDHAALFLFVKEALENRRIQGKKVPKLYTGVVHSLAGDDIWPLREQAVRGFTCPPGFEETSKLKWEARLSFPVPKSMEEENRSRNLKYQALSRHVTALKPDAVDYLYSFVKGEELFWLV